MRRPVLVHSFKLFAIRPWVGESICTTSDCPPGSIMLGVPFGT